MLVEQALAGDDGAFELLMERYKPVVLGYLAVRSSSKGALEDLVQEAFFAAYTRLATLKKRDRFGPWVMAIARNELRAFYRSQNAKRRTAVAVQSLDADTAEEIAAASSGPREQASESEVRELVLQAIAEMREKYAVVLHMRLIGELTPHEIAQRMGLEEGTVRVRLYRGLRKLRRALVVKGLGNKEVL